MPHITSSATAAATDNGESEEPEGPGKPGEALAAVVSELAKRPTVKGPDEAVARAVATGWHAREALTVARQPVADGDHQHAGATTHPGHAITAIEHAVDVIEHAIFEHPIAEDHPVPPARTNGKALSFVDPSDGAFFLKDVHSLDAGDRTQLVCWQLTADLAGLESKLKAAGQDVALVTAKIKDLANSRDDRETVACELGSIFAQLLLAADFRLGKAYSLGWDMASLVQDLPAGHEPSTFQTRLGAKHEGLRVQLRMLATLLPPNVGHSVRRSLDIWTEDFCGTALPDGVTPPGEARKKQAKRTAKEVLGQTDATTITSQMQTWRALLTGEKAAKDVLHADDLVSVSAKTMGRLAHAIGKGVKQAKLAAMVLGGAAVLLVALGVLLITQGDSGGEIAGVTALVGSFGLTWKSVGSTVGSGLAKLEQPLWNAEVDEVIAVAITKLPRAPTARRNRRL